MKTRAEKNREFDDKFDTYYGWPKDHSHIPYPEEIKDFLHQTRLEVKLETLKAVEEWAENERPVSTKAGSEYARGHVEVIDNLLAFLSTLHTNLTME